MAIATGRIAKCGKVVYDVYTLLHDSYTTFIGYLYDNHDFIKIAIGNEILIRWLKRAAMTLWQPKRLKVGNMFA